MIIKEINLANFGPFYGKKIITFGNGGEGVHLIRGKTGQGKTSIQRSIIWCLYGKVGDRNGNEIRPTSLLNITARKRDEYDFFVNLILTHEGKSWIIHRRMTAHSHNDKDYLSHMKLTLTIDGETSANPEQTIQRLISPLVSKFFFFDGEMLDEYEELLYDSGIRTNLLRESIERVLGIPYLKNAKEDMNSVQKNIELQRARLLRRLGGRTYDDLLAQFDEVQKNIGDSERFISETERQIYTLENEILDDKRNLTRIETVRKLSTERNQLESDISRYKAEKEKEQTKLNQMTSQLYKVILRGIAGSLISGLQLKHERTMSKYNKKQKLLGAREQIIKGMSDQKCRLCGSILNETKLQELKSQLDEIDIEIQELTEIPEPNLEFERYASVLTKMLNSTEDKEMIRTIETEIQKIEHNIAALTSRLNAVKESLAGQDEEEPRRIEMNIRAKEKEKGRLEGQIEDERETLREFLIMKSELDQKIASIDQSELKILAERIRVIDSIEKILEKAISVYREQKKTEVESVATEIFKNLKSKESFDRLEINNQFGLNIITKSGTVLDRGELRSAGEEQIVALSLIGALNRCAKIDAPVFMDTPFGRLDVEYSEKVLSFIPKLAKEVTLLITDKEFRPGDEKYLNGQISSDFTLTYYGEEKGSEIHYTNGGTVNE
jgi:DNA sulfur modification protein DndD